MSEGSVGEFSRATMSYAAVKRKIDHAAGLTSANAGDFHVVRVHTFPAVKTPLARTVWFRGLGLYACGSDGGVNSPLPLTGSYTLAAARPTVTILRGGDSEAKILIEREGGLWGPVTLSITGTAGPHRDARPVERVRSNGHHDVC